jgi:hypothetical protein
MKLETYEGVQYRFCDWCAYDKYRKDGGCIAYHERPRKCMNHTTAAEGKQREEEIKKYAKDKEKRDKMLQAVKDKYEKLKNIEKTQNADKCGCFKEKGVI